jgi:hypothetical protein
MATPDQFKQIHEFIIEAVAKMRNFQPGPQHADDPERLRGVMQAVKINFPTADLSEDQAKRLFDSFQVEAQQYRQQYHKYFPPTGAYDGVLGDIHAMLDHLKKRG